MMNIELNPLYQREIPPTLSNILGITRLSIENTMIPEAMRDMILASCRDKRDWIQKEDTLE